MHSWSQVRRRVLSSCSSERASWLLLNRMASFSKRCVLSLVGIKFGNQHAPIGLFLFKTRSNKIYLLWQAKFPPGPHTVRRSVPLNDFLHRLMRDFPIPSICSHAALHTWCPVTCWQFERFPRKHSITSHLIFIQSAIFLVSRWFNRLVNIFWVVFWQALPWMNHSLRLFAPASCWRDHKRASCVDLLRSQKARTTLSSIATGIRQPQWQHGLRIASTTLCFELPDWAKTDSFCFFVLDTAWRDWRRSKVKSTCAVPRSSEKRVELLDADSVEACDDESSSFPSGILAGQCVHDTDLK